MKLLVHGKDSGGPEQPSRLIIVRCVFHTEFLSAYSEDSDQIMKMPMLISVLDGCCFSYALVRLGCYVRKPIFGSFGTTKTHTSMPISDQRLCYSLIEKYHI